jgi:hypothetical protein
LTITSLDLCKPEEIRPTLPGLSFPHSLYISSSLHIKFHITRVILKEKRKKNRYGIRKKLNFIK